VAPDVEYRWERLGASSGGAVTGIAASPDFGHDATLFAATMAGLFHSSDAGRRWRRADAGFQGVSLTAVAVSPDFARDGLALVASLEGGLYRVTGDGASWGAGDFQGRRVTITALALSPDFARDGLAFAATMADGVFISRNRGISWEPATFGLLDLDVSALTLSPGFARDGTLFAATASGVFRSPNGGRAWRELRFPEEAAPVQCLAISPAFGDDGVLFAGTVAAGLFRSRDRGATWHAVGPAQRDACVNGIALSPGFADDHTVLLVTDAAVYVSGDAGETWALRVEAPGALCLALAPAFPSGGPALVGLSHDGILRSNEALADWQPANEGLAARQWTGLALSPTVARDRLLVAFGAGEGIARSFDGGATWVEVSDGLPSRQVTSVAIGGPPTAAGGRRLYAALPDGLWLQGEQVVWEQGGDWPARLLVASLALARDGTLIVGMDDGGILVLDDDPRQWRRVSVPWPRREILALAVSPAFERDQRVFVALRQPDGPRIEVWQGALGGGWTPMAAYESATPRAALAVPATLPWDGAWYAAIGEHIYGPLGGVPGQAGTPAGQALSRERPAIVGLAMLPGPPLSGVVAATGRALYLLAQGSREWQPITGPEAPQSIVAVAPAPGGADGAAYLLEGGGTLWRLHLATSAR